jgi:ABC-type proline/glycine betaine transport system permease subunit
VNAPSASDAINMAQDTAMAASESRVASASNWLVTSSYAYLAFVASTRLATTAARWAAALLGASVVYVLVMLALAAFWQHDSAHAAVCCALGMVVAVLCAAWATSTILLPAHRDAGAWTCMILGMLYPLLLAAVSAPGTPVRTMQFLYVAAAAVGGVASLWTLPLRRGVPLQRIARA